jgi:hypothetical protein
MKVSQAAAALLSLALPVASQTPCGPPGVTVTVTPAVAAPGEIIRVTLTNDSASTITLPTSCVYLGIHPSADCSGDSIESFICLFTFTPIPPGESVWMEWDQTDDAGLQVPAGTYSFSISHFDGGCCPTVSIVGNVPALPAPALGVLLGLAALAASWVLRRR